MLRHLGTKNLTVMKDVEKDTSVFADIDLDLKNKISSFEMIGWTDPSNPQVNKPM